MKPIACTTVVSLAVACGCLLAGVVTFTSVSAEDAYTGGWTPGSVLLDSPVEWLFLLSLSFFSVYLSLRQLSCSIRFALAAGVLLVVSFSCALARSPKPSICDLVHHAGKRVCFLGKVDGVLGNGRLIVKPVQALVPGEERLAGRVLVSVRHPNRRHSPSQESATVPPFQVGETVKVTGRVRIPAGKIYPWDFDYRSYLYRDGIFCQCQAWQCLSGKDEVPLTGNDASAFSARYYQQWQKYLQGFREHIVETHRKNIGDRQGALQSAMVIGDKSIELPASIVEKFRDTGLSHLLAASGFNLSIIAGGVYFLARLLGAAPPVRVALAIQSILAFVCLAGPSPSVVRSAIMCSLVLLLRLSYRTVNTGAALSSTLLLMLLCDPLSVMDVGMQLSYAAAAGIIYGASGKNASRRHSKVPIVSTAIDTVRVILLAQAAVLPLQIQYFWEVGVVFLLANLLVDPVVAPITICGFVTAALLLIDYQLSLSSASACALLAPVLDWLIACLDGVSSLGLTYMLAVAERLSSAQGGMIAVGPAGLLAVATYYTTLIALVVALRIKSLRAYALLLWIVGLAILLLRAPLPSTLVVMTTRFVLVIQGDDARIVGGPCLESERLIKFFAVRRLLPEKVPPQDAVHVYRVGDCCVIAGKSASQAVPLRAQYARSFSFADDALSYSAANRGDSKRGSRVQIVWLRGKGSGIKFDGTRGIYLSRCSWGKALVYFLPNENPGNPGSLAVTRLAELLGPLRKSSKVGELTGYLPNQQ